MIFAASEACQHRLVPLALQALASAQDIDAAMATDLPRVAPPVSRKAAAAAHQPKAPRCSSVLSDTELL